MTVDRILSNVIGVVSAAVLGMAFASWLDVFRALGLVSMAAILTYVADVAIGWIKLWLEHRRAKPSYLKSQSTSRRRPGLEPLDHRERLRGPW